MIEGAPSITKYTFISHKCNVTKHVIPTSFFYTRLLFRHTYFILDELTPNAETNSHGTVPKDSYLHLGVSITLAMGSCETLLPL